jgi:putative transposase
MRRRLRFIPDHGALVEVTSRALHSPLLLRPGQGRPRVAPTPGRGSLDAGCRGGPRPPSDLAESNRSRFVSLLSDTFLCMSTDPPSRRRRSIRLKGYRYAWMGFYFVTICTHERQCLFGKISDRRMTLSEMGLLVDEEWRRAPLIRPEVRLDRFVVMPNHLHGLLQLSPGAASQGIEADRRPGPEAKSLGAIIGGFKAACTSRINGLRSTPGAPVWQRNYFERVIRDEAELAAIRRYIENNPAAWAEDEENPDRS